MIVTPTLHFNEKCEKAITLYQKVRIRAYYEIKITLPKKVNLCYHRTRLMEARSFRIYYIFET